VKLRRDARNLKQKALSSLRRGLVAFNAYDDDGRITTVLLHFQHCCEMLVKAALVQKRVNIFDGSGRTFSLEKCANLAKQHCGVTEGEAGLMRALDSLRNAEQHWFIRIDEDVLYLHARGLVTLSTIFSSGISRMTFQATCRHGYYPCRLKLLVTSILSWTESSRKSVICSPLDGGHETKHAVAFVRCSRWSRM
jgi:hypothetical protein